jgi:hypothetical protein
MAGQFHCLGQKSALLELGWYAKRPTLKQAPSGSFIWPFTRATIKPHSTKYGVTYGRITYRQTNWLSLNPYLLYH